jgi:hypothetical protein
MKITFWRIKQAFTCFKNGGGLENSMYWFNSAFKFDGK